MVSSGKATAAVVYMPVIHPVPILEHSVCQQCCAYSLTSCSKTDSQSSVAILRNFAFGGLSCKQVYSFASDIYIM